MFTLALRAAAGMQELLPGILSQMGPESLQYLQKMASMAGAAPASSGDGEDEDLEVDFEAAAEGEAEAAETTAEPAE